MVKTWWLLSTLASVEGGILSRGALCEQQKLEVAICKKKKGVFKTMEGHGPLPVSTPTPSGGIKMVPEAFNSMM